MNKYFYYCTTHAQHIHVLYLNNELIHALYTQDNSLHPLENHQKSTQVVFEILQLKVPKNQQFDKLFSDNRPINII